MKKKINRILAVVVAIFMAVSMTACGGETAPETTQMPETTAAPTTEPVNVCETNGHTWVDATCDVAKTCDLCGETEGEALGHTWVEATYDAPKTCETCGATEGEALVSYFVESGLEEKLLAPAGEYSYTLVCGDETKTTVANVIVEDYQTIVSDETHEAMDGYEWKILSLKLHFADENAAKHSFYPGGYLWTDRYVAVISDDSNNDKKNDDGVIEDLFGEGMAQTFAWNGVEYTDGWLRIEENFTEWMQDEEGNYYIDFFVTVSVRVPVGYDGFVLGMNDHTWKWTEGKYLHEVITDNTLLFCFD